MKQEKDLGKTNKKSVVVIVTTDIMHRRSEKCSALEFYSFLEYCLEHERAGFLPTCFDSTHLGLRMSVLVSRT